MLGGAEIGPRVRTTAEIAATLHCGRRGDLNHSIPVAAPLRLPAVDLPADPWAVGYWLGNGKTGAPEVSGHAADAEYVLGRIGALGWVGLLALDARGSQCFRVRADAFRYAAKAGKAGVPAPFLRGSVEQRLEVLRGLMDSDGHAGRAQVEFCSTTRQLAVDVHELAASLGQKPVISEGRATLNGADYGPKWRVTWRPTVQVFGSPRKAGAMRLNGGAQAHRNRHRMIVSADPIPPQPMRCISVDSPNAMYLVGRGMIPTHNTRAGAEDTFHYAAWNAGTRTAVVAPTQADLRKTIFEGDSGLLSVIPQACLLGGSRDSSYNSSIFQITLWNGSIIQGFSAEKPDRLRGPQFHRAWCLSGSTMVLMSDGSEKRIDAVRAGDAVLTRSGPRRVAAASMTSPSAEVFRVRVGETTSVVGTTNHQVYVYGRGFTPIRDLNVGDVLCLALSGSAGNGGCALTGIGATPPASASTEKSTGSITASSPPASTFITRMGIGGTTTQATSSPSLASTTWPTMRLGEGISGIATKLRRLFARAGRKLSLAMRFARHAAPASKAGAWRPRVASAAPFAWSDIGRTPLSQSSEIASNVASDISPRNASRGSVAGRAAVDTRQPIRAASGSSRALIAEVPFNPVGATLGSASVGAPSTTTAPISGVERCETPEPVYDLTIEGAHEFFANGILVHNCDELAAWVRLQDTWDNLQFGLRLGESPRVMVTTTPRPLRLVKQLMEERGSIISRSSTYANRANLAASFLEKMERTYEGTRLGRQELHGEVLTDTPNALWTLANIDEHRRRLSDVPPMARIVVAIDPAASNNPGSDETGIVVVGKGTDGHGYVLDDLSLKGIPVGQRSPTGTHERGWADVAVDAYRTRQADAIVAEVNNGGDMVEAVLRGVDANVSYRAVKASRGKVIRAEPVAALYSRGIIHHVGGFPTLEDQMATFTSDYDREKSGYSPDRMDALVWALTELYIEDTGAAGIFDYYRSLAAKQSKAA